LVGQIVAGYRNSFEARCGRDLGPGFTYEPMKLAYTLTCSYTPDFVDPVNKRIVEAKGRFPASDRRKMLAVKAQHPDYTYEIWFVSPDAPITKGSKTTNRIWAERHGFTVCQGPRR
jgi:hypothetical protein